EIDGFVGDLRLGQDMLDDVVFEYQGLDLGAALAVGQIIRYDLGRLLVVLGQLFDAGAYLLGLGAQLGAVDEFGNQQAQAHTALGFGREGLGGNRQTVGIGHAALLEFFARRRDTVLRVVLDQ